MPKLFIRSSGRLVNTVELRPGLNRLGRDPNSDCCVDDPTVSSHHCEILVSDESVLVKDLGSTNGTFVEGQRVTEAELSAGQSLRLGLVEIGLDTPPIHVAVPPSLAPDLPVPTFLPDGTPCCLNHPGVPADYACSQCSRLFCAACVRELRRIGGEAMMFCRACDGACGPLAPPPRAAGKPRSLVASFTQRLKETFRIYRPPPRRRGSR